MISDFPNSPPARAAAAVTGFPDEWYPVALPHVEVAAGGLSFLGRQVTPPDQFSAAQWDLLKCCDGSLPLNGFGDRERELLAEWRRVGLLVLAPPLDGGTRPGELPAVVSPHPDDAVLALGGMLAGRRGRVMDVFTVETWTNDPYYAARPALTSRLLLAEEVVACRVVGAEVELFGFTDAADRPLRHQRFLSDDPGSDRSALEESDLLAAVRTRLLESVAVAGEIFAPLGVGGHVDHLICREAVVRDAAAGELAGTTIFLYEDQPYSVFAPAEALANTLDQRFLRLGIGRLRPELILSDERAVIVKREAMRAYRIQVRRGFRDRVARRGAHLAGSRHPGAERVWRLSKT